ncbi:MAG: phosphatidylserine decarboxylase family protein [Bacteroidetes bacterium]|nr:phosphatidylserine decarboxylase family protein [Bacteroidota bacterium]
MRIHREGYMIILITLIITIVLLTGINLLFPSQTPFHYLFYLALAVMDLLIIRFFRSPERPVNPQKDEILAPADGKVVVIEEVEENEYFNEKRLQVSIFMSPTNVHVNWYPIEGDIIYYKYHPGQHLIAFHPKSSHCNERTTTVIRHESGKEVLVRQIAGGMARRIVSYAQEGAHVTPAQELGFIKFGSRVDLLLPTDTLIETKLKQKVTGSSTIIGRIKS